MKITAKILVVAFAVLLVTQLPAAEKDDSAKAKNQQKEQYAKIRICIIGTETIDGKDQKILSIQKNLEKSLRKKGFKIYDLSQLKEVRRREFLSALRAEEKKLSKWAKEIPVDIIIEYQGESELKRVIELSGNPAFNYVADSEFRMIKLQTAEVLETVSKKTDDAALDKKQAGRKALTKAAGKAFEDLFKVLKKSIKEEEQQQKEK